MDIQSYILWLLLIIVCAISGYWHFRENKHLSRLWREALDNKISADLIRFAWSRSIQLFSALSCLVLLVVMYDWQLNQSRNEIQQLNEKVATEQALLAQAMATQQNALPKEHLSPDAPKPADNSMADIYNPEEYTAGNASAIDGLKKRYEEILVTHFFLARCGIAQPIDFHIINSALSQEMASINAPGRLQNDILTAAKGSYKEMYSQTRCEGSGMEALQVQYNDYIAALTKNYDKP